ncbi:MAG: hypothetical protein LBU14_01675 [Candidatus Peribacteria bacterium]|nr:hypothetical protein [Candidatus Peribacteria bacterium]
MKLANSIDRIIENYKTDEQLLNYLINAISLKLADVKNKTAQNALLYLSYNANYYLLL